MTDSPTPDRAALPGPLAALARIGPLARMLAAPAEPRRPARARVEVALALLWGALCHALFAAAVGAMILAMGFGMSRSLGAVPQPWAWGANLLLLLQFPLAHSLLLSRPGRAVLGRLAPAGTGRTLATTTYAIVASLQLLALFALWTPSGVVWWRAEGPALALMLALYAASWAFLVKASWDAGAEVQSGALGWISLLRGARPRFPLMPVGGAFRLIRQPIYLAFALTTWTVPVWTPDQLLLASVLTAYCALGPMLKERRFDAMFGARWRAYKARTGYWWPKRKTP
jgi:protein-S-isoprenylcysteine O-methyltransferase Ste14